MWTTLLSLNEAIDVAQNHPLWRLTFTLRRRRRRRRHACACKSTASCNPIARITYTVLVETLNHAQSKRACNLQRY